MALTDNILAYWRLDETSGTRYDSVSNLQITETNGTIGSSSGIINAAANITNGDSAWLTLPAGICDIGSGQKTFSLWFYLEQTGIGYQWIGPMNGTGRDYTEHNVAYIEGASFLNCIFTTSDGSWTNYISYTGNDAPTAGVWHHAVAVFDGSKCTLYYDGQYANEQSYSGPIISSGSSYTLGMYAPYNPSSNIGGASFNGKIDELAIWDRVLTSQEVAELYNNGSGLDLFPSANPPKNAFLKVKNTNNVILDNSSLLLHFNGSNTSTNIVDSSIHSNPITVLGNAQISTDTSVFGGTSLKLTDSNSYLQYTNTDDFTFDGDFCIECFVYLNDTSTRIILENRTNLNAYEDYVMYITTAFLGENGVGFVTGNNFRVDASSTTIPNNTWTHIAVTRENGVFRIFTNGIRDNTTGTNNNTLTPAAAIGSIGGSSDYTNFNGYIDELRITKGSAVYTANFTPPSTPFGYSNNNAFLKIKSSSLPVTGASANNDIQAYWKLDNDGSGNVSTVDSTGNGHTLTNNGVPLGEGIIGNGGQWPVPYDNETTPWLEYTGLNLTGNFSVSCWFKPSTFSDQSFIIPLCLGGGDGSNHRIAPFVNPAGEMYWIVDTSADTLNLSINFNTWNHICIIGNTSTGEATFYINGVASSPVTISTSSTYNNIFLGVANDQAYSGGSYILEGNLDEVGVWNRILTPDEVNVIYNGGSGNPYPFQTAISKNSFFKIRRV